jgi:hypothetical protein
MNALQTATAFKDSPRGSANTASTSWRAGVAGGGVSLRDLIR